MDKIAFIIDDSLVYGDDQLCDHHYLVHLPIIDFSDVHHPVEYGQNQPINFADLAHKLTQKHDLKTAAMVSGEAEILLRQLLQQYEKIVIIGISPKLSSSYHQWQLLLEEFSEFQDRILLLPNISLGDYYLNFTTQLLTQNNHDFSWSHIKTVLSPLLDFKGILLVQDLSCLSRGGRISSFQSVLGELLKIKVLIQYQMGELKFYAKQMSLKKILTKLVQFVRMELQIDSTQTYHLKLWTSFVDEHQFQALYQTICDLFPNVVFKVVQCPKPILVHVGLDVVAISW